MATLTTEMALVKAVLSLPEEFTSKQAHQAMTYPISAASMSNYLRDWCQVGALVKVRRGTFRKENEEILQALFFEKWETSQKFESIKPNPGFLTDENAFYLNGTAKLIRAMRRLRLEAGHTAAQYFDHETKDTIRQLRNYIHTLNSYKMSQLEAVNIIDRQAKDVKPLLKKIYPETWEAHLELLRVKIGDKEPKTEPEPEIEPVLYHVCASHWRDITGKPVPDDPGIDSSYPCEVPSGCVLEYYSDLVVTEDQFKKWRAS